MKNLTHPDQIKKELGLKYDGQYGAVRRFAREHGFHEKSVSANISVAKTARRQPKILQPLANLLGKGVHGVYPEKEGEKAA